MIEFIFKKKYKKNFSSVRRGMTFSEVIVAIAIFSIVMVGVNQLFIKSWQNYNLVIHTSESSIAANRGASEVVNVLRKTTNPDNGAYPILSAGSFDIKFFSDIDKDDVVEKVHYYLSGTNLMVGTSESSGFPPVYPVGDTESSVLIRNVVNNGTQPLFYFYDGGNNIISDTVGNLNDIRMVEVNLFIDRKEGDLNIESYASLRNLSDYDTIK